MRSRIITLLTLALLPTMLWASGNTVGRGDLSVSFEASHSNTQMVDTIHIKGPLGSLSAEMLLPKGFDRENGRCELVILLHGFLGSKKAAPLGFLARMLVKQGYAVLRFDFDGYGKSEGAQVTNTVPGMIQDARAVWECIGPPLCPSDCPPRSFARRSRSRDACRSVGKGRDTPVGTDSARSGFYPERVCETRTFSLGPL